MPLPAAAVQGIFVRHLGAMRSEVEAYPDDATLWAPLPGIANPGGVLAHHCAGNLRHFIGGVLGKSGYVRDRTAEFGRRDLTREDLLVMLDAALGDVTTVLPRLTEDDLLRDFPVRIGDLPPSTGEHLVWLVAHLGYHLGQVNYHRRIAGERREARGEGPE